MPSTKLQATCNETKENQQSFVSKWIARSIADVLLWAVNYSLGGTMKYVTLAVEPVSKWCLHPHESVYTKLWLGEVAILRLFIESRNNDKELCNLQIWLHVVFVALFIYCLVIELKMIWISSNLNVHILSMYPKTRCVLTLLPRITAVRISNQKPTIFSSSLFLPVPVRKCCDSIINRIRLLSLNPLQFITAINLY